MPKIFAAFDWYWLAKDGRLFGSARQGLVTNPATDEPFLAWGEDGTVPQTWPPDATGAQSNAGLQAVLTPYGLYADLNAYASNVQNETLAKVWSFNVAAASAPAHTVTTKLDPSGQSSMLQIAVWTQLNAGSTTAELPYSNVDFSSTNLSVAEATSLSAQTGALKIKSYAILNQIASGIAASPPTITTKAQIDEAFAALAA